MRWFPLLTIFIFGVAMAEQNDVLEVLQVGAYQEIASRPNPEKHEIVFIPSLAAILLAKEESMGRPLTEAEVVSIRDTSIVTVMPTGDVSLAVREYEDVNPINVWVSWKQLRSQLVTK
jgi:hypothetical protein